MSRPNGYKLGKLARESSAQDVNRASVRLFRHRRYNLVISPACNNSIRVPIQTYQFP
jgi:hypothetical protein